MLHKRSTTGNKSKVTISVSRFLQLSQYKARTFFSYADQNLVQQGWTVDSMKLDIDKKKEEKNSEVQKTE